MKTLQRNREIASKRTAGATLRTLADEFKLSAERVRRICKSFDESTPAPMARLGRSTTFSQDDFKIVRALVARYTMSGVVDELSRIAWNYGNTSPRYKTVARRLRAVFRNTQGVQPQAGGKVVDFRKGGTRLASDSASASSLAETSDTVEGASKGSDPDRS
jgi:transposase InsO family protein